MDMKISRTSGERLLILENTKTLNYYKRKVKLKMSNKNQENTSPKGFELKISSPLNYLEDPLIKDYFKADDYLNYYETIALFDSRNMAEEVISHNYNLLLSLSKKESFKKINTIIKESNTGKINTNTNINITANQLNHEGYELLSIEKDLSKEYLTERYRNACKKYHPDIGGSNEKMQIINIAFGQFKNLFKEYHFEVDEYEYPYMRIRTINDFKYAIASQLLSICMDIKCVDKALNVYNYLKENILTVKKYRDHFEEYGGRQLFRLGIWLFKLGNVEQAEIILADFVKFCTNKIEKGFNYHHRSIKEVEEVLKGNHRFLIVIKHQVQARNAFRSNLIDKKRYDKLTKRFNERNKLGQLNEKKLNDYILIFGSFFDIGDYKKPNDYIEKDYIPGYNFGRDDYFQRFDSLTMDQKIEYMNMFSYPVNMLNIRKYNKTLKQSYLLSLVQNYKDFEPEKNIRECNLLADVLGDKIYLLIIDAFNHLKSIDSIERNEKLNMLNQMDKDYFSTRSFVGNYRTLRIEPTVSYTMFITAPLEEMIKWHKGKLNHLPSGSGWK